MSIIAEVAIDGGGFTVGRALAAPRGTTVELEQVVPLDDGIFPYCRVRSEDEPEVFEEALASNPAITSVTRVESDDDGDSGDLYAIVWSADAVDGILAAITETRGQVLSATARDGRWRFTLRFPTSGRLADFQRTTTDADDDVDVGRVYAVADGKPDPDFGMTAPQLDALVTAVETGYFRVPRAISTVDLGAILGISDQAASERLRRGVETLVRNALDVPEHRD